MLSLRPGSEWTSAMPDGHNRAPGAKVIRDISVLLCCRTDKLPCWTALIWLRHVCQTSDKSNAGGRGLIGERGCEKDRLATSQHPHLTSSLSPLQRGVSASVQNVPKKRVPQNRRATWAAFSPTVVAADAAAVPKSRGRSTTQRPLIKLVGLYH